MKALLITVVTWLCALPLQAAVVIGSKDFVEQEILGAMTRQLLEARGFEVEQREPVSGRLLRKAMESDRVDIYWEYTGTSLKLFHRVEEYLMPDEAYEYVKLKDAERGIVWLRQSQVNNSNALAMRRDKAEALKIRTITDLAEAYRQQQPLQLACTVDFDNRRDGMRRLQAHYDFLIPVEALQRVERLIGYEMLAADDVQVALAYTTDSRLNGRDLVLLVDDKFFFPSYMLAPVIRREVLVKTPKIAEPLNRLSASLTNAKITELIRQVEVDKQPPDSVARKFLLDNGML